jgi:PP-loop superfamily ATP-utilizing enzyme
MNMIPDNTEKIHLLFSGGVDSTILLYLLCKEKQERNLSIPVICHIMPPKLKNADVIISYISEKFSHPIELMFWKKKFLIRRLVDNIQKIYGGVVFSGCNRVLTEEFTPSYHIPGDTPPVRGPALNEAHLRPFIDMDKAEIVKIYVENNEMTLLDKTISCGAYNDETGVGCGGECYFCLEREWAFKENNINNEVKIKTL